MLKYTIAGLIIAVAAGAAAMIGLSRLNDSGAEAGPAPLITLTITDAGSNPPRLDLVRSQIVELRIQNERDLAIIARIHSDDVEQLPVSTQAGQGWTGAPRTGFELLVTPGAWNAALLRLNKSGDYTLTLETPGRPETRTAVTLTAR